MTRGILIRAVAIAAAWTAPGLAMAQDGAQDDATELAKKLSNPVASLISVPFQYNYDCCFGPDDGARQTLNIQPVMPVKLNDDWNLIVRTIVPLVYQESPAPGVEDSYGLSDVTQSFFFSPQSKDGLTWAVGPVFLWPVGTDELGTNKWGAGPTGLVLKQQGQNTYGLLANHIWSYAGSKARDDVSQTFLQPFYSYTTHDATTWGANLEASYDWTHETWSVPANLSVSHLYNFGGQRVSLGVGAKVYLVNETNAPDWGLRAVATFLFPK